MSEPWNQLGSRSLLRIRFPENSCPFGNPAEFFYVTAFFIWYHLFVKHEDTWQKPYSHSTQMPSMSVCAAIFILLATVHPSFFSWFLHILTRCYCRLTYSYTLVYVLLPPTHASDIHENSTLQDILRTALTSSPLPPCMFHNDVTTRYQTPCGTPSKPWYQRNKT